MHGVNISAIRTNNITTTPLATPSARESIDIASRLPDAASIKEHQTAPSDAARAGADTFIKKHTDSLLVGTGKALMLTGAVLAVVLAPLTISGAILGAAAAKIAKEKNIMPGEEHKLLTAGLIVGSLGTAGLYILGKTLATREQNTTKPSSSSSMTSTVKDVLPKQQSKVTELSASPAQHATMQKTSFSEIPRHELIELLNILNENISLGTGSHELRQFYEKYGDVVINPKSLFIEINKITNKGVKDDAMRLLFKFQMNNIGHDFSLGGNINIESKKTSFSRKIENWIKGQSWKTELTKLANEEIALEGSSRKLAFIKLFSSVSSFAENKDLNKDAETVKTVVKSIENGIELTNNPHTNLKDLSDKINNGELVTFSTGWRGHAVTITIKGDLLAYSNRGQVLDQKSAPGIHIYKIGNKEGITEDFLQKLLDADAIDSTLSHEEIIKEKQILLEAKPEQGKTTLKGELQLEFVGRISNKPQKVGNCSWASAKCAFQAGLVLTKMDELKESNHLDPKISEKRCVKKRLENAQKECTPIFKSFDLNHKRLELENIIEFLNENNENDKFLSEKDQFSLFSQFLQKFVGLDEEKTPDYNKQDYIAIKNVCDQILEKTKNVTISNAIISMNDCPREDADKAAQIFVSRELSSNGRTERSDKERNLPGAFAIIEDKEGIQLHYCTRFTENKPGAIPKSKKETVILNENLDQQGKYYQIKGRNEKFRTIEDIAKFVQSKSQDERFPNNAPLAFPVAEIALINEFKSDTLGKKY